MKDVFLSSDFIIISEHDTDFYIIKKLPFQKFAINQDSYQILKLIQEQGGLPEDGEPLAEHITTFLQQLQEIGILTSDSTRQSSASVKKTPMAPYCKRIFLEMTPHCNLKCQHCYNAHEEEPVIPEKTLTTDEVKTLIDQAHDMGVWQFELTGGELFLRKDLFEILAYLNQKGMLVTLFSNLTLLDELSAKRLKELNVHRVNTSLDGFSDEVHDRFRGMKGARQKTIESIHLLKEQGIAINVNVMVGEHNFSEIDPFIDSLRFDLQVSYMADVILPQGRGSNVTNFADYAPYLGYLNYMKGQQEPCNVSNMGEFEVPPQIDCGVGRNFMYISHEGSVNLCNSLTRRVSAEFCFGNVRDRQLSDLWNTCVTTFKNLTCKDHATCSAQDKCKGGCRSRAYTVYGALDHPDEVYCQIYGSQTKKE